MISDGGRGASKGLGFAFAVSAGAFSTESVEKGVGAAQMLGPDLISPLSKLYLGDALDYIWTVLDVVDLLERSRGT